MINKDKPYHVQTTAVEVIDGFPSFQFHDSVSRLWFDKWRKPCAAGVYPFTDADVTDFDIIFAELITISRDDAGVLKRPNDYAKPFMPVADRLVLQAEDALSRGNVGAARTLFLRAAAVYRIARFPVVRSPLGEQAWAKGKSAYEKGSAMLDPPSVPVAIPFAHADVARGDLATPIQAYLRVPKCGKPESGFPLLLFICGLDAYRTDHTPRINEHLRRGFATLSFEIPGTGDSPAAPGDPESPDRLMTSLLDWVASSAALHGFDLSKVVARGISTGGYYAFRVAHTHAQRLFAVVAQGGGCHHAFDPVWIEAQHQMEYPFALADALAWKFGYRDDDLTIAVRRYADEASKFSLLSAGVLDRTACRMLVINGMEDSIFPIEDSFLVATRGTGKDLVARGDRGHMGNPGAEVILYDWIDATVAGSE